MPVFGFLIFEFEKILKISVFCGISFLMSYFIPSFVPVTWESFQTPFCQSLQIASYVHCQISFRQSNSSVGVVGEFPAPILRYIRDCDFWIHKLKNF